MVNTSWETHKKGLGYNVDSALNAHITAVTDGSFVVGIKNWGNGTANDQLTLRFKLFHNLK